MILSDREIRKLCQGPQPMLDPFSEPRRGQGIVSWGLSTCGYDLRLSGEIAVYKSTCGEVVDVKRFRTDPEYADRVFDHFRYFDGNGVIIPAHGYVLGRAVESFSMPRDVVGYVVGKSTYARAGIIINVTPIEPGWRGDLTIEIANHNPGPAKVYVGEGIAQVLFFRIEGEVEVDYSMKGGLYQSQVGVTPPRV